MGEAEVAEVVEVEEVAAVAKMAEVAEVHETEKAGVAGDGLEAAAEQSVDTLARYLTSWHSSCRVERRFPQGCSPGRTGTPPSRLR